MFQHHYFVPMPPEAGKPLPPVSMWRCSRCGVEHPVTTLPVTSTLCHGRWEVDTAKAQEQADKFLFDLGDPSASEASLALAIKIIRELAGEIDRIRSGR